MKKVFALMMVCGFAAAFVACGPSTADSEKAKQDSIAAADSAAAAQAKADSAAAAAAVIDSAAAPAAPAEQPK